MFKKVYTNIDVYDVFEIANGRFVLEDYPLYVAFLAAGNEPEKVSGSKYVTVTNGVVSFDNALFFADAKLAAKNTLYRNRTARDLSGVLINGVKIATDEKSQALLSQAYVGAKNGLLENGTSWKTESGYINITKEQIIAIYEAVFNFIKTNFENEKVKYELIESAATLEELNAIDISL